MASVVASISNFYLDSTWTLQNGSYVLSPSTAKTTKAFSVSGIPSGNKVTNAVLSMSIGSPYTGIDRLTVNGKSASAGTHSQTVSVSGNGSYSYEFVFRANGTTSASDGEHSGSLTISDCKLTVTYEQDTSPEPDPDPEIVIESERLICLYAPDATRFDNNGICVLSPISCMITETAGGAYNLDMEHPIDEHGKWALITEGSIIRAPVPHIHIPAITVPAASVWRVKSTVQSTPLYTRLPTYEAAKTEYGDVVNNPSSYAWNAETAYSIYSYVVFRGNIYEAGQSMAAGIAPTEIAARNKWIFRGSVSSAGQGSGSSSGGSYDPGEIAETLAADEIITKIADYSSMYMQVRSVRGVVGYVLRSDCELSDQSASGTTIPARDIVTQLFRVVTIGTDETNQSITVSARHISYDYQGNSLFDCQLNEADPMSAIAILQGSLMMKDDRKIICNATSPKITADWSFKNPIMALLDPDDGLLAKINGRLIRDNDTFYLLTNTNQNSGVRIAYGVNLIGVEWTRNIEDLVTRIVPRAGNGSGGYLYLNELFVDSPNINDYPTIRVEVLDTQWAVGQEIDLADGTTKTLTVEDCKKKMREDAESRFSNDHADAVVVSISVNFLLLGDTEEYNQYKGLQTLNMYDIITIETGPSGLEIQAQMNSYEWDALTLRYTEISVGDIRAMTRKHIPGYRMNNGSISIAKLTPSLAKAIRGE